MKAHGAAPEAVAASGTAESTSGQDDYMRDAIRRCKRHVVAESQHDSSHY